MINKPEIIKNIGDYLDLDVEGRYECTNGSETYTVSVDAALAVQRDQTYKDMMKAFVEWLRQYGGDAIYYKGDPEPKQARFDIPWEAWQALQEQAK